MTAGRVDLPNRLSVISFSLLFTHPGSAGKDEPHPASSPLHLLPISFLHCDPGLYLHSHVDQSAVLERLSQHGVRGILTPPPRLSLPSICSEPSLCQAWGSNASINSTGIYGVLLCALHCVPLPPPQPLVLPAVTTLIPSAQDGGKVRERGLFPVPSTSLLQISGTRAEQTAGASHGFDLCQTSSQ